MLYGTYTDAVLLYRRSTRSVGNIFAQCGNRRLSFQIDAAEYDTVIFGCGIYGHRNLYSRMQTFARESHRFIQCVLFC